MRIFSGLPPATCCALAAEGALRAARNDEWCSASFRKLKPMTSINIEPNVQDFDAFYEALIDSHRDLTTAQSHEMNAKLVLMLANHIGDVNVLRDAMQRARATV
jgi:Protein of unknown function (DUF2783)